MEINNKFIVNEGLYIGSLKSGDKANPWLDQYIMKIMYNEHYAPVQVFEMGSYIIRKGQI